MTQHPIKFMEQLQLTTVGINANNLNFETVTMESDKFICVREKVGDTTQIVIIDMNDTKNPIKKSISADSAIVNPVGRLIAVKSQRSLYIFYIETFSKHRLYTMQEMVIFWKWISQTTLALVTGTAVYHWSIEGNSSPKKVFNRHPSLNGYTIVNYLTDTKQSRFLLIGIDFFGSTSVDHNNFTVTSDMQLYSIEDNVPKKKRSKHIKGHAASFAEFKMNGNPEASNLLCYAVTTKQDNELHIIEVGKRSSGNRPFPKKVVKMFFPPEAKNDYSVSIQVSSKYDLIYLITSLGYIHIYDIESATCIFIIRIPGGEFFIIAPHEASGGIIGINRKGQVLSVFVGEENFIYYINKVLKNPHLALRMAVRNNLSGIEDLFITKLNMLLQQRQYAEAAKIAANAPGGMLRTPETIQLLKQVPKTRDQAAPLLQYFEILLEQGELNEYESLEYCRLISVQSSANYILSRWLDENKLKCSEEMGDLLAKRNHTARSALKVYLKAKVPQSKVIQHFVLNGEFEKIAPYAKKVSYTLNYIFLLKNVLRISCFWGLIFARLLMLGDEPLVDINEVIDIFTELNMGRECEFFLTNLEINRILSRKNSQIQKDLLSLRGDNLTQVANAFLDNQASTFRDPNRSYNVLFNDKERLLQEKKNQKRQPIVQNKSTPSCCICLSNAPCYLMLPCKHLCMCNDCKDTYNDPACPICRIRIKEKLQIFTS